LTFFLLNPLPLLAGLLSAGAGHGDYIWARILFPYPLLFSQLVRLTGLSETAAFPTLQAIFLLLAIAQFPIMGKLIDYGAALGKQKTVVSRLILAHLISVVPLFAFGEMWSG